MCCPCTHCGKCIDRQGRCLTCHEKLPETFSSVCPKCGAVQPLPPGASIKVKLSNVSRRLS
jgi:hypothetical protein